MMKISVDHVRICLLYDFDLKTIAGALRNDFPERLASTTELTVRGS